MTFDTPTTPQEIDEILQHIRYQLERTRSHRMVVSNLYEGAKVAGMTITLDLALNDPFDIPSFEE